MTIGKTKLKSSSLIKTAVYFAAEKHDGQYRKGTHVPFFAHSILVAFDVLKYSGDENITAAAILHDVLEDCPKVTKMQLKKLFGNKVAKIVSEVSSVEKKHKKNKIWKEKKLTYISKIKNASKEALIVVAADKINNMKAYFESVQLRGPKKLSKVFGGSLQEYFWYYKEILTILKSGLGNHPIVKEYEKIIKFYELTLT